MFAGGVLFYSNASDGFIYLFFPFLRVLAVERLLCLQKYSVLRKITLWFVFMQTEQKKKVFSYTIFSFGRPFVKSDFAFYHFNGFPSSCSIKLITEHSPLSFVSVCEGVPNSNSNNNNNNRVGKTPVRYVQYVYTSYYYIYIRMLYKVTAQ